MAEMQMLWGKVQKYMVRRDNWGFECLLVYVAVSRCMLYPVTQEIFKSYDLEDLGAISSHKMREAISAAGNEQMNTGNIVT